MTSTDVRSCLTLLWPDSEYLCVEEAPEDSSRGGRKIDLLVMSLWRSRGLQRDAVEIKVSYHDWVRERDRAEKADFWWRHTHRFWLAVPAELIARVQSELPETWGLLSCTTGEKPKVVKKAPHHEAQELPWNVCVGVMRAAANCGVNALLRAESKGREEGRKQGLAQAERSGPDGYAVEQLKELQRKVTDFEQASGVTITGWDLDNIGAIVALVKKEYWNPRHTLNAATRSAERLEAVIDQLRKEAREAVALAKLIADSTGAHAIDAQEANVG